jgi:two-component system NtrC family sensor kinase
MKFITIILFCCYSFILNAQENAFVYNQNKGLQIGQGVQVLEDNTNALKLSDVMNSNNFKPYNKPVVNLGVSSSDFWIKFSIFNNSGENNLVLDIAQPVLNIAELYTNNANGEYVVQQAGTSLPFEKRYYQHQNLIFNLKIPPHESRMIFLKVRSNIQIILPITVGRAQSVFETLANRDMLFGIFFGVVFCMFFYNIFIYFTVRDSIYIYYVFYILLVSLAQSSLFGYSFKYLWPDSLWLAQNSVMISTNLGAIAACIFTKKFLHTKLYLPKLDKLFSVIISIFVLSLLLFFMNEKQQSFMIMQNCTLLAAVYIIMLALLTLKKGYRPAKYFLFAWLFICAGSAIVVLRDYGIIPITNFTSNAQEGGFAAEVILLAFALADKINVYKKEKEQSQAESLRISKENERLIQQQNIILEQKIAERTKALEQTLNELKDAQIQLVESEKMASLGQLTAGIAHEINNPINFVKSNVKPLQMDVQDLFELINRYQKLHTEVERKEMPLLNDIKLFEEEIDPEFIKEEINNLIVGIEEGAERTAEIVRSLRNFSRLDESEKKVANVHEGIDSTLILLKNTLPDYLKIIKHFNAEGDIECYPSKLNQVFMNIITNAIQAIKSKENIGEESIVISTRTVNENMEISIKDSGIGMTEDVRHKIFDPFFTTKEVGEGTGLGMSITFKIIEKHQGKIAVVSAPGCGTEITISIPYQQSNFPS